MRNFLACLLIAFAAGSLSAQTSDSSQTETKAASASRAVASDSHEGVTIAVTPWTQESQYKQNFPKRSPLSKGIVAIRVSFKNDNDHGLKVNLQSIRLLVQVSDDTRQQLVPLSADDVADTVMLKNSGRDPTAKRTPIPIPLPTTGKSSLRDKNWTNFRDDCQSAAVPTSVLAAHSTVEGLLYFDLRGETDLLQDAHMYFPNIVSMGDNQPLSYFDIALGHDSSD